MKPRTFFVTFALIMVAVAAFVVAGERPWLDMQNCDFCKPWTANGLMSVMTHEQLPISNGVLVISTVPADRMEDFKKTSAMMNEIGQRAAKGEKVTMCGSCETMGSFFGRGAKMEEVWTKNGSAMIFTSSDPALVAEMHSWVKKNDEEYAKLMNSVEKKK